MQDLLGELDSNPEMAAKFEELMKELGDAAQTAVETEDKEATTAGSAPEATKATSSKEPVPSTPKAAPAPAAAKAPGAAAAPSDANFQESIRKTMERMQNSSESASAAAASSSQDDFLTQLLKEMETNPGAFPSDMGSDEDFSKMLMGMMEQLTNKEVLYEPMKELNDKFPAWMEENRGKVGQDDWKRYEEQSVLVKEIVAKFDSKGYSDEKVECREYIVERMQKVCSTWYDCRLMH
jgi:peroxin-19